MTAVYLAKLLHWKYLSVQNADPFVAVCGPPQNVLGDWNLHVDMPISSGYFLHEDLALALGVRAVNGRVTLEWVAS